MAVRDLPDGDGAGAGDGDGRPERAPRIVPQLGLPDKAAEAQAGSVPKDAVSQRLLIPLLVYAIDKRSVVAVRELIENNPNGIRATFVIHNLGRTRMEWLREKGLIE